MRNVSRRILAALLTAFACVAVVTPAHARFVSVDPVKPDTHTGEDFNRYAYARGNPYGYVDPDGRLPIAIPIVIGVGWLLTSGDANAPRPGEPTHSMSAGEAAGRFADALPLGRVGNAIRIGVDASGKRPEPPNLVLGKRAHREELVKPSEQAEVRTPSGKRMDRYDAENAHIREIKPNNARAVRQGEKQVEGYRQEMEAATGRPHTAEVSTYDPENYRP